MEGSLIPLAYICKYVVCIFCSITLTLSGMCDTLVHACHSLHSFCCTQTSIHTHTHTRFAYSVQRCIVHTSRTTAHTHQHTQARITYHDIVARSAIKQQSACLHKPKLQTPQCFLPLCFLQITNRLHAPHFLHTKCMCFCHLRTEIKQHRHFSRRRQRMPSHQPQRWDRNGNTTHPFKNTHLIHPPMHTSPWTPHTHTHTHTNTTHHKT
jgi:hypothetical protein